MALLINAILCSLFCTFSTVLLGYSIYSFIYIAFYLHSYSALWSIVLSIPCMAVSYMIFWKYLPLFYSQIRAEFDEKNHETVKGV